MHAVRQPAVAGSFYPADPRALASQVESDLAQGRAGVGTAPPPKAVVAPHAGYVYSGECAGWAFAEAERRAGDVERVVLLGPCHRVPVRGLALSGSRAWVTPLGEVPVADADVAARHLPHVVPSPDVHRWEHSLEVEVPFLQAVLGAFTLVPLAVGDATPGEVADVLDALWGGDETLIVISSDLSHYLPYDKARQADERTLAQILDLSGPLDHGQACGATPLNGMLEAARRHALVPDLLDARNSGDTAGDRRRVVGYASLAFREAAS